MPGKTQPKARRLKKVQVSMVSLVSKGANLQPGLLKGHAGGIEIKALAKADVQGLLHVLVYVPNVLDAHGDWMGPDDVQFAQHSHMRSGANHDIHHDLQPLTKDQVYSVEVFTLQGQDNRFPDKDREGRPVEHKGAWAEIIKIEDPALLAKALAGELNEVSLYAAPGKYEAVEEDLPLSKDAAGNSPTPPRKLMDENKLAEALAKFLAPITAALTALTTSVGELKAAAPPKREETPVTKTEEKPKGFERDADGRPLFKGDATDSLELLRYHRALEDWTLVKSFEGEMGDPDAVRALVGCQAKLAELRKAEDKKLGLPGLAVGGVGQSLRKQLQEQSSGAPSMSPGTEGVWMKPTDEGGFKEILATADKHLEALGLAKAKAKKGEA